MAKTKISEWSTTPASNTDIDGINIAEGCAPSGINDAIRELMSQVKDLYSGTTGDAISIAGGGTGQVTANAAFNALAPSQTSNSGKYLTTNGTSTSWATVSSTGNLGFTNRIINGDMRIDQRNAGASVSITNANQYSVDRWSGQSSTAGSKYTLQQSSTAPAGFTKSLLATSTSAYTLAAGDYFLIDQVIEGSNWADLAWGTANAATVTLSFWVRSSLTGTFGGALKSYSGAAYGYPFSYTISAADTWEQKSITIAGPTSTWAASTTNGGAVEVLFSMGTGTTYSGTAGAWVASTRFSATGATSVVGTNGATFYVTGVQLEKASTATSFDYRPYGTELALCQRYFETSSSAGTAPANGVYSFASSGANANSSGGLWFSYHWVFFKVNKRISTPTMTFYGSSGLPQWLNNGTWTTLSFIDVGTADGSGVQSDSGVTIRTGTTGSQYNAIYIRGTWTASAEL
jgi:hypothetical protein